MSYDVIKIEKINNVHIRIYADLGIEQELSDFFTFEVPGYKFMPSYKAGVFDGKIRLYSLKTKTLYVGLLDYVLAFAENNKYKVDFLNDVISKEQFKIEEVFQYAKSLSLTGSGKLIDIRDYQINAILKALVDKRTLLLSPTASGKSLIIYTIMRHHLQYNRKCVIIVPTVSLVNQMVSDFKDYSSANGWNAKDNIGMIMAGCDKTPKTKVIKFTMKDGTISKYRLNDQVATKRGVVLAKDITYDDDDVADIELEEDLTPVVVTTWQSVYKQSKQWFNQFDVVFGDEAHLFKANSLSSIMEKMTSIEYRIGTTGTLDNTKVNKLVLEGLFGPVHKVTTTSELMQSNHVANLKIKCIVLQYDKITRSMMLKKKYQDEMDFIVSHEKRNKFIRNLAISCEGNTLILFQYVEKHGKVLYDLINSKVGENRKVFFIYGATDAETRESARIMSEKETNAIIIASYGVFSTGVNIPSIQNVIFASPSKSKIRNLQSIGRGLRLKKGKTHCILFDIADDLHHKSWVNHTLNHLKERIKIYAEEKFSFKVMEVPIE